MSGTKFERDPGFERQVLGERWVGDLLEELVSTAAARASDLAPDDPATTGKDLHSSVYGDVELVGGRYRARVGATDFKANWFEHGAVGVPARPFLRPAVEEIIGPIEADPGGE